jgi:MoxR-like ATPases
MENSAQLAGAESAGTAAQLAGAESAGTAAQLAGAESASTFRSVAELTQALRDGGYLADRGLATTLFVGLTLDRPILIEGEVGVGKTEVAKTLATVLHRRLIRLQCYEGIDTNQALYEWDYARQMLYIRALSQRELDADDSVEKLFGPRFLLERPLLAAVRAGRQAVLLIDEIDRADDEFEAFLLEVLSDFQITVPEIGTIRAEAPPLVILTSNRTRELHDALKRRCLYHWVDYPDPDREVAIVLTRAPGVSEALTRKVVAAVNRLRSLDLAKPPGVAETIDWVRTLEVLGETDLDARTVSDTLGAVIKERDDLDLARRNLDRIAAGG